MRELNPRAWSVFGECWCTRVDYDGHKKEWSGVIPIYAPDNRSKYIGEIEDTNIVLELPTGLKDKNGKEIYEGDIVEYSWDFCGEKRKNNYVVEWLSGKVEHYPYSVDSGFTLPDSVDGYMVVGNIHENPELIEKEKRMKPIPLCSNCLNILNIYGGCDKCNKLLLKEIDDMDK